MRVVARERFGELALRVIHAFRAKIGRTSLLVHDLSSKLDADRPRSRSTTLAPPSGRLRGLREASMLESLERAEGQQPKG